MKTLILIAALCPALVLVSCDNAGKTEDISWLIGSWEGHDVNDLTFYEHWQRSGKSSFDCTAVTITPDGDTLIKETPKIEVVEGVPYYVTTVPEKKGAILFKMVKGNATSAIFENRDHSFPQRISYLLESNNSMKIKLEGFKKGQPQVETLRFERMKENSPLQ
jgi:hypothetical protein